MCLFTQFRHIEGSDHLGLTGETLVANEVQVTSHFSLHT